MTTTTLSVRDGLLAGGAAMGALSKWLTAQENAAEERHPAGVIPSHSVEPSPSVAPSLYPCPYEPLIRSVWTMDADWAVGIAWRESNCRPEVTSAHGARGLFQLMPVHTDDGCAYDAECNARTAFALYQQCGRGPWSPPYYCERPTT